MNRRKVFLDLDGVAADFESYFESFFGFRHNSVSDTEMWRHIEGHSDFFRNLPPMEGIQGLYSVLKYSGCEVLALTGCPRSFYQRAATQKREWAHEHLDPDLHVLPVIGGKNKYLFIHRPGDILIDDFEKNLGPWRAAGGVGILHRNVDETILEFNQRIRTGT